jgi:hypothetical protein
MGIPRLTILLALVLSMSVGCDSCVKKEVVPPPDDGDDEDTTTTATTATTCNGTTCVVVIRVATDCMPVDASNMVQAHASANPGDVICIFNGRTHNIKLTIPTGLIETPSAPTAPYQEYTLAPEQCASFVVPAAAAEQTFTYTISDTECPSSHGHGNPDVKVGGGEEGGG